MAAVIDAGQTGGVDIGGRCRVGIGTHINLIGTLLADSRRIESEAGDDTRTANLVGSEELLAVAVVV